MGTLYFCSTVTTASPEQPWKECEYPQEETAGDAEETPNNSEEATEIQAEGDKDEREPYDDRVAEEWFKSKSEILAHHKKVRHRFKGGPLPLDYSDIERHEQAIKNLASKL